MWVWGDFEMSSSFTVLDSFPPFDQTIAPPFQKVDSLVCLAARRQRDFC